ncbi:hypothetical protein HRI_003806800 [Hibiscus trionum]|uniref:RING-type E3 ubiquitin transferase n=1 Tax=Hibiscus trionum TaxID=183268 RepID=A0A9W7MKY9_HIBTR|nr:hypothetical protein HRI_003806800 [Hibiscus trionum]
MALVPISVQVSFLGLLREYHPLPVDDIQVKLSIATDLRRIDPVTGYSYSIPPDTITPFSPFELVSFGLSILQNLDQLRQLLDPWFARVGLNTASILYDALVEDIVECGIRAARTSVDAGESDRGTLCLICCIQAVLTDTDIDGDTWLTTALAESESEFEVNNYGMVAAREASIEQMLERVEVEAGDETCVICLNELEVGFEACRMPCSHGFHGDCIQKWLRQSHYCPICRFEMPTD